MVRREVSFALHLVPETALMRFSLLLHLLMTYSICSDQVRDLSNIIPRNLAECLMLIGDPPTSTLMFGLFVECVNKTPTVFSMEILKPHVLHQCWRTSRSFWTAFCNQMMFGPGLKKVLSSAKSETEVLDSLAYH